MVKRMAERDDIADSELVSHFRNPPGWSCVIQRMAALGFGPPQTVGQIKEHYAALAVIVLEELPPSSERTRLLERFAEFEAQALIEVGALVTH
jgi:hypothetical protein